MKKWTLKCPNQMLIMLACFPVSSYARIAPTASTLLLSKVSVSSWMVGGRLCMALRPNSHLCRRRSRRWIHHCLLQFHFTLSLCLRRQYNNHPNRRLVLCSFCLGCVSRSDGFFSLLYHDTDQSRSSKTSRHQSVWLSYRWIESTCFIFTCSHAVSTCTVQFNPCGKPISVKSHITEFISLRANSGRKRCKLVFAYFTCNRSLQQYLLTCPKKNQSFLKYARSVIYQSMKEHITAPFAIIAC